ncbi:hypothetical protein BS78_08G090700 [Paspalum vaginatum]|nr:hypothetical protein BS78_08G090700 [Paspalum vaginatum]
MNEWATFGPSVSVSFRRHPIDGSRPRALSSLPPRPAPHPLRPPPTTLCSPTARNSSRIGDLEPSLSSRLSRAGVELRSTETEPTVPCWGTNVRSDHQVCRHIHGEVDGPSRHRVRVLLQCVSRFFPSAQTLASGFLAVISVNLVIGFYICMAMKETPHHQQPQPDPTFLANARASINQPASSQASDEDSKAKGKVE